MDPQYVNWLASSGLEHVPGNMVSFRYTVLFECTGFAESRTIYRSDSSSLYLGHGGMLFPSAVDVSGTMCIMRSRGRPTDRQIVYSLFLLTRRLWEISFRSRASYLRGTQKKDKQTHVWWEHRYKCVYRDQHCARYTFSRNAYPLSFVFLTLEEKAWKPIGIQHLFLSPIVNAVAYLLASFATDRKRQQYLAFSTLYSSSQQIVC